MKRMLLAGAMALALFGAAPGRAENSFETLFAPLSKGGCVAMSDVRSAGAVVELAPELFQFVRAFYMEIPPVSHQFPPGDKAFYAKDASGVGVFGLFDGDGHVCAVFQSTDWLEKLIDEVGRGDSGQVGDGT